MRIVTTTYNVFTYDELGFEAKKFARENYRKHFVHSDWREQHTRDMQKILKEFGFISPGVETWVHSEGIGGAFITCEDVDILHWGRSMTLLNLGYTRAFYKALADKRVSVNLSIGCGDIKRPQGMKINNLEVIFKEGCNTRSKNIFRDRAGYVAGCILEHARALAFSLWKLLEKEYNNATTDTAIRDLFMAPGNENKYEFLADGTLKDWEDKDWKAFREVLHENTL